MNLNVASVIQQSLIQALKPLIFPGFLVFALIVVWLIFRYRQLSKSGILAIDKMTGSGFETRLTILFKKLGYSVKQVGNQKGDYGVDLVIGKDGTKTTVQAKCYKKWKVGEDAIREVLAGKSVYGCSQGWVITNSQFTYMAKKLAKANQIKLIDRWELIKLLKV